MEPKDKRETAIAERERETEKAIADTLPVIGEMPPEAVDDAVRYLDDAMEENQKTPKPMPAAAKKSGLAALFAPLFVLVVAFSSMGCKGVGLTAEEKDLIRREVRLGVQERVDQAMVKVFDKVSDKLEESLTGLDISAETKAEISGLIEKKYVEFKDAAKAEVGDAVDDKVEDLLGKVPTREEGEESNGWLGGLISTLLPTLLGAIRRG